MAPSEDSPVHVIRGIVPRQGTGDAGQSGSASPSPGDGSSSSPSPSPSPSNSSTTTTSSSTSTTTSHTTSSSTTTSPPPTSSSTSTTSSTTSSTTTSSSTSTPPPTSSSTTESHSSTTTSPPSSTTKPSSSTTVVTVTSTTTGSATSPTNGASHSPTPITGGSEGGLKSSAKVAIGVVVPIAAIAILAVIALFWWRKRKARLESEEERRKEVEDYSYNPNADPTIPAVGLVTGDAAGYEMREDGYRGWGSTTVAGSSSAGRKSSAAGALSDSTAPRAAGYDAHDGGSSPEGEILGAMGPAAANNRGGDVHRGPSNASSSYSATGRSEGSDGGGMYPGGAAYYDQYGHGAYGEGGAVIRDNPARRNTQIENTSHYPQQSAGIAQNF